MRKIRQKFTGIALAALAISMVGCGGGKQIDAVKLIPVKVGKEFQYVDADLFKKPDTASAIFIPKAVRTIGRLFLGAMRSKT